MVDVAVGRKGGPQVVEEVGDRREENLVAPVLPFTRRSDRKVGLADAVGSVKAQPAVGIVGPALHVGFRRL